MRVQEDHVRGFGANDVQDVGGRVRTFIEGNRHWVPASELGMTKQVIVDERLFHVFQIEWSKAGDH